MENEEQRLTQMKATVVAICGPPHVLGWEACTCLMIWAMVSDMTATGPIDTSLEVAKNWGVINMVIETKMEAGAHAVDGDTDEGRVETIFSGKGGEL